MAKSDRLFCTTKRLWCLFLDGSALASLTILQGAVLNYYIIQHYTESNSSLFFFIADFLCVVSFVGTLTASYRHFKSFHSPDDCDYPDRTNKRRLRLTPHSYIGLLPFSYVSWIFYTVILVTKICVIFLSGLVEKLKSDERFGPQLLQVTLAATSFVFLLLVEGHNWAKRGTPRFAYVTSTCAKTSIEIFDSISFLSILLDHVKDSKEVLSNTQENVILIFAAINFFLPSVALYRLSASDFAMSKQSFPLTVLYYVLHLFLVDIPFLVVRIYLWLALGERASMFLMKNILSIVLTLRGMYPDLMELKGDIVSCTSKSKQPKDQLEEVSLNEANKFEER